LEALARATVAAKGRLEDHDGNVDQMVSGVEEERPGQLEHRREVADADARVQHHRLLLHGSADDDSLNC